MAVQEFMRKEGTVEQEMLLQLLSRVEMLEKENDALQNRLEKDPYVTRRRLVTVGQDTCYFFFRIHLQRTTTTDHLVKHLEALAQEACRLTGSSRADFCHMLWVSHPKAFNRCFEGTVVTKSHRNWRAIDLARTFENVLGDELERDASNIVTNVYDQDQLLQTLNLIHMREADRNKSKWPGNFPSQKLVQSTLSFRQFRNNHGIFTDGAGHVSNDLVSSRLEKAERDLEDSLQNVPSWLPKVKFEHPDSSIVPRP